jgi:8-amino-7-oxononanoate synthase|uniref:Pyridoxal phosphate-dependent aminotransferase family protein n=1 Tax=Desulfobacca acetoxidans TaxID=60893 RepID=A0A7V6A560_9BACT
MMLKDRCLTFNRFIQGARAQGLYPYFRPIARSWGPEVEVNGRRLIMIGSNDYLGLSHDPRVQEAAMQAIRRWGTGPGGSRFLSGNMTLHETLEERLAEFVGKKKAVVHVTGFSTNLGAIGCLLTSQDIILVDRENHASIFEGCQASKARLVPFAHNDPKAAAEKIISSRQKNPDGVMVLITEGVFSMSGDVCPLPELVALKEDFPELLIYLDDAHGLGTLGPGGRGVAAHFGLTSKVDFIMGTFSKALASIGGFLASDEEEVLEYVRHHSRTLIFSAALPASCAATVLACLDIIESEPERLENLWRIIRKAHQGYQEIGLLTGPPTSPVLPIHIGSDLKAALLAADLLAEGIFALPAIYPAVPRGKALIRTAYMSTHQESHLDFVLEVLDRLARKHRIRAEDLGDKSRILDPAGIATRTAIDPALGIVGK